MRLKKRLTQREREEAKARKLALLKQYIAEVPTEERTRRETELEKIKPVMSYEE